MIYSENIFVCMIVPVFVTLIFVKGNARRLELNFIIGMTACLLGAYISGFFNAVTGMGVEDTAIFISPVVEEGMKFLPLLFYFHMFEPDDDNIFLAAVGIGAGFATYENVCYMVSSGAESLSYLLIRGLAVGVMHIVSVYASVFGLVIARKLKAMRISSMVGALSLSMLFHGTYNLLVSQPGITSYIGFTVPLLTAFAMLFAMKSLKKA